MPYWVGVVGSRDAVNRLRTEDLTWWCVPKEAAAGDLLAMYVARSRLRDLPEDQGGIVAIFEITGPDPERDTDCRQFGGGGGMQVLAPVKIAVRQCFSISLKLVEMKRDKRLSASPVCSEIFSRHVLYSLLPPVLPHVILLLDASRAMLPRQSPWRSWIRIFD